MRDEKIDTNYESIPDYSAVKEISYDLFDEIEAYVKNVLLKDYESFENTFSKMSPSKELYMRLIDKDNWELYNRVENYNRYYYNWRNELIKEFKSAIKRNKDEVSVKNDFLTSYKLHDISMNIATGIIIDAINGEQKNMSK